ncbi:MAG TPA: helix-turn-helix domain-containing protein [Candidatus Limnocylindria bacterium]|nr:helix-turn-helix domain-containing protein [Candidatus Limnocylindria bacterium]
MQQQPRLIQDLSNLGLTTYEAKAYVALLGRGSFTAAQVARQGELPRQRIYDVLSSLVEKGLASAKPGSVVKYSATAPDLGIQRLVAAHRRTLEELEMSAAGLVAELAPAYESGRSNTDPLEYIEVLRDAGAISERFAELQAGVKEEILVFTKPPYATLPQENVEGLQVALTHRARGVYEMSVFDEDPQVIAAIKRFVEAGEEARFVEHLPLKLVIIDETIVMFGMQDPVGSGSDLTIMVVEHPSLAIVLKTAFEAIWDQGLTLEDAERRVRATRRKSA